MELPKPDDVFRKETVIDDKNVSAGDVLVLRKVSGSFDSSRERTKYCIVIRRKLTRIEVIYEADDVSHSDTKSTTISLEKLKDDYDVIAHLKQDDLRDL